MKKIWLCLGAALLMAALSLGTVFGTVRGIVHDPQHRPMAGMEVVLKAKASDYSQTTQTDTSGEFHFDAVPLGEYTVTASAAGFTREEQTVTVLSGTAPIDPAFRVGAFFAQRNRTGFRRGFGGADGVRNADDAGEPAGYRGHAGRHPGK